MTDRDDPKLSSEELIQQARYGLDTEDFSAAPPAGQTIESPGPVVREPIRPSAFPGEEPPPGAADPYGAGTETEAPPPGYGEPLHGDQTYLPPAPPSRRSSGSGIAKFGGWILIGVLLFGGFAWRAITGTKAVEDLVVGECINEPDEEIITDIKTVDCNELHDYEVYEVIQVPYGTTAAYPGDENLFWEVLEMCVGHFDSFVGLDYADSIYDVNAIYPTRESWEEQDDREATCLISQYSSSGDILQVSGSLRGVGR